MERATQDLCRSIRDRGLWTRWDSAPGLGCLMVTGGDAVSFLQAQLTSDVAALSPGGHQLSAKVNRKGCLVGWFSLHRLPERGQPFPTFMMVMPRTGVGPVRSDLEKFIVNDDVLLEDASLDFDGIILAGGEADQAEFPDLMRLTSVWTGEPEHLFLWPRNQRSAEIFNRLAAWAEDRQWVHLDGSAAAESTWDSLRIEAGWPIVGRDLEVGEMVLPQTGLERHVVSTTKGCYLGQEVLARIRTYGSVKLALRGITLSGLSHENLQGIAPVGTDILDANGNAIGLWASRTHSVVWDSAVALVFLDREHRTSGATVSLMSPQGILSARVVMLPFHLAGDYSEQAQNLHQRAVHLFSLGRDAEAAGLLENAIGLDPNHHDSYEALGVILGRGELYHEAIDIFHRLEEVVPDEPMVHTNLSLYYMKIGNREEAERQKSLATMKHLGGGDPEIRREQEMAERQARAQEANRKRAMFAQVLEVDPTDPLALMGMGNALIDLEEYDKAEVCLERALTSQQDNSSLYLARARVLEKLSRKDDARDVLRAGVAVASRRGDLMPLREMEHRLFLLG